MGGSEMEQNAGGGGMSGGPGGMGSSIGGTGSMGGNGNMGGGGGGYTNGDGMGGQEMVYVSFCSSLETSISNSNL